jgi:hypothetical protein
MALWILRAVFILVAAGLGTIIVNSNLFPPNPAWLPLIAFMGVMLLALAVISLDVFFPQKQIDTISAVYFGIIVGFFLTYVIGLALTPYLDFRPGAAGEISRGGAVQLLLGMVLCYTCISLLLQTKDDFRFIIPYVELAYDVKWSVL